MSFAIEKSGIAFLLALCLIYPFARGDETEGVKLKIATVENKNLIRFTVTNEGKNPTESFYGHLSPIGYRVLRPDGCVDTSGKYGLFTDVKEILPGQEISVTKTSEQIAGSSRLNGTHKVQMLYRNHKSDVVSFEIKREDGEKPNRSRVARDVIQWYGMLGKNVAIFDTLMAGSEGEVQGATRRSLLALSVAQQEFFSAVELKFGEEATHADWIFAWNEKHMADDFWEGKVEVSDTLETATLEPKGWGMKFHLRLGPTDRWLVDVRTFSDSEFKRKELTVSIEKLQKLKTEVDKDKYASLQEVIKAVNQAYKP